MQRIFTFEVVAVSKGKSQNREKIKRRKNPQLKEKKKSHASNRMKAML